MQFLSVLRRIILGAYYQFKSSNRGPSGICPTSERRRSKNNALSSEERFLRIWDERLFWPVPYGHSAGFGGNIALNESYSSQQRRAKTVPVPPYRRLADQSDSRTISWLVVIAPKTIIITVATTILNFGNKRSLRIHFSLHLIGPS
jgi:hypothetical protein